MLCSPPHFRSSREQNLLNPAHLLIKDRIGADCELNFEIQLKTNEEKQKIWGKDMKTTTKIFNPKCNLMLSELVTLIDAARQLEELPMLLKVMLLLGLLHIPTRSGLHWEKLKKKTPQS